MPDSPDRQVPPPPPTGGAAPIPDVDAHTGQAPRRGAEQGTPSPRPTPPARGAARVGAPVPSVPPAPPTPSAPPAPPVPPAEPREAPAARRIPTRRQPLGQSEHRRDQASRPSARERLQRLANAQTETPGTHAKATPHRHAPQRTAVPQGTSARHQDDQRTPLAARQPQRPDPQTASAPPRGERRIPTRGEPVAPVVPEPPLRPSTPVTAGRIPEPPARPTGPAPARRRPTSRILEALDAKLAADQAEQAKAKTVERVKHDALRRVRPALSSRRPTPPKAPTPSVTSSVPIAPRVPHPSRGLRDDMPGVPGDPTRTKRPADGVPLPDPSVPPVPVIPLKPVVPQPSAVAEISDMPLMTEVGEPAPDPLAASYERLVKAAKRQAALEAALSPDPAGAEPSSATAASPDLSSPVMAPESAPSLEPTPEALHEEFEQAKRDADRFFGPDDFTPHGDPDDVSSPEAETDGVSIISTTEGDLINQDTLTPRPAPDDHAGDVDAEPTPIFAGGGDDAVITPEEVTPPSGIPVLTGDPDIEDAEIVAETSFGDADDVIGTIIATDLDLVTGPETIAVVEPATVVVDEPVLTAMPVEEAAINAALASAPARVVEEPDAAPAPVSEPKPEDTPPQSRGFRALTAVLILIIFALVCIAAYRMMMRPGNGMVEPTPTPIVPTAQSDQPGASASPSRNPKVSEVPTPVPALPPREPLPSDAAIPPALPGQSMTPEVMGGAGNVEIGQHTIALSQINDVNLPGLIDKPVAGENVQVQSILGDGAYVWMGSDQDNRILAVIPEPFREALKDLQAGDRVDFIGTLGAADVPEILAPEQGRDRLIRQGAAIEVRDITVRQ